jgi:nitrate/nitrite-specific signal transduction histidine kinase
MNGLTDEVCSDKMQSPTTSVVIEGQPRIVNASIALEICKIAREALLNAFSHARARRIQSEVAYSKRALRLRFRDDGIGISSAILRDGGRPGHWGISGMMERAKSIHGRLTILGKPGTGTEVELTIPGFVAFATNTSDNRLRRSRR